MFKLNCTYLLSQFLTPQQYAYVGIGIMLIVVAYILVLYRSFFVYLGAALLGAGTFLNAGQRIQTGCVKDFYNFFNLFNFNLADIFVTLGIIIIIFAVERYENSITYRR